MADTATTVRVKIGLISVTREIDVEVEDADGLKLGNGSEQADAADLNGDVVHYGRSLPGLELVGDVPPRVLGRRAQFFLIVPSVHLDDYAVGLVGEGVPYLF